MKKKGFTLVELLCVIVVLSIIVALGGISINGVMKHSNKKMLEIKKKSVCDAAILYAQEENVLLSDFCKINEEKYYCNCKVKINSLLEKNYLDGKEKDYEEIKNSKICIYRKNNRIYAYID